MSESLTNRRLEKADRMFRYTSIEKWWEGNFSASCRFIKNAFRVFSSIMSQCLWIKTRMHQKLWLRVAWMDRFMMWILVVTTEAVGVHDSMECEESFEFDWENKIFRCRRRGWCRLWLLLIGIEDYQSSGGSFFVRKVVKGRKTLPVFAGMCSCKWINQGWQMIVFS